MSVWDNGNFVNFWNDTYGLDMAKAPIRPGIIYPLLDARIWPADIPSPPALRLVDFGCGNGNLIRALKDRPFSEWVGIDNGRAILETAQYLAEDPRISFLGGDVGQEIPEISGYSGFDHSISVFTLEEIPSEHVIIFFKNMAASVFRRQGSVHIFTQHPSYALQQDWAAFTSGKENTKFQGHRGYFDTRKTSYRLSAMNAEKGFPEMADYHHKPLGMIITAIASTGLRIREMIEIPSGAVTMKELEESSPRSGDVPRFLYIEASYGPTPRAGNKTGQDGPGFS